MIIRFIVLITNVTAFFCQADDWNTSRPDSHAPISIMGEHTHKKGEWMLSYRAMFMQMEGNLEGTDNVSNDQIFSQGYMMAPDEMRMTMHMFGLMFATSDQITWMLMLPYIDNQMEMTMKNSMSSSMGGMSDDGMSPMDMTMQHDSDSSGFGDTRFGAMMNILDNHSDRAHISLGLSFPTGSIDVKDETRLPYPMQLGSGTWDILPGITWSKQLPVFSYGAQLSAVIRTGQNKHDYRLGNQYALNSWIAKPFNHLISASLSLGYNYTANIKGKDEQMEKVRNTPTARADLRAGKKIQAGAGVNIKLPAGNRLALEYQTPVYQDLEGPQMDLKHTLTVGWQLSI